MQITYRNVDPSNGEANYPEWLMNATPGAHDAKAAWRAALADSKTANQVLAEASAAVSALAHRGPNRPKRDDVPTADYDAALAAESMAATARRKAEQRAKKARMDFDDLMRASAPTHRATAAQVALSKHEELIAAWETLRQLFVDREEAHYYAGRPGRSWQSLRAAGNSFDPFGEKVQAVMRAAIGGFDVRALQDLVASGPEPTSEAENELSGQKVRPVRRSRKPLTDAAEIEEYK